MFSRHVNFILLGFIASYLSLALFPLAHAQLNQAVTLLLALVFGIGAGSAAEKTYVFVRPSISAPLGLRATLFLLVVGIIVLAYGFGVLVFHFIARF